MMARADRLHRHRRGMAVVSALLIVMVATVIVSGLLQRQSIDVRAMENALARSQGRLLLDGGLDWAGMVLRFDGQKYSTTQGDQLWSIPVEDTRISQSDDGRVAVFSGSMEDEQGKFNLRNLAENASIRLDALTAFMRLLTTLGLPPGLAEVVAERVAWGQSQMGPEGNMVRRPLAPALETLEDLSILDTITPAVIETLRPYATVLPEITAVNANTASAEVLAAVVPDLDINLARSVTAQRDRGVWFNNRSDFANRLGNPQIAVSDAQIVVDSSWFLVKGAVTLDRSVIATRALVHRDASNMPKTVWKREFH